MPRTMTPRPISKALISPRLVAHGEVWIDGDGKRPVLLGRDRAQDVVHDQRGHVVTLAQGHPCRSDEPSEVTQWPSGAGLDGIRECDDVGAVGHGRDRLADGERVGSKRLRGRTVAGRLGHGGEQEVGDLDEKLLLASDVPVEGPGGDPQLAGQAPHRQVTEAVATQQVGGGRDHLLTAQRHPVASPRENTDTRARRADVDSRAW